MEIDSQALMAQVLMKGLAAMQKILSSQGCNKFEYCGIKDIADTVKVKYIINILLTYNLLWIVCSSVLTEPSASNIATSNKQLCTLKKL